MGVKDSKPSFISYEEASKRVSDSELRRIREAFKRCAGVNGTALSLDAFVHQVLCDGVPYEVAEWLYQACGGTKRGIAFKELICGIVVLTKGSFEEKIKFLWTLYVNNQSDNGTYIYKRDFSRALHVENNSLPVTQVQRTAEILTSLFGSGERVSFEQFRSWLLMHRDATVLSKWLLADYARVSHELETPTFYQSLAGVTHLEERDIIELEKCFWTLHNQAPTGQLDLVSLTPLISPPLPKEAVAGFFLAFDENRDGHIDFKELCCGLSAACRGPTTERLKFCFKVFDLDRDGILNGKELIDMVTILCAVANETHKMQESRASTPSDSSLSTDGLEPDAVLLQLKEQLRNELPGDLVTAEEEQPLESLSQEDFLIWSVERATGVVAPFLSVVLELCHVVLGLRVCCVEQERRVVLGWLRRAESAGYSVGQFWYLVSSRWWQHWRAYSHHPPRQHCPRAHSIQSMSSLWCRSELETECGSVESAASSSGVSSSGQSVPRPGPIDNSDLYCKHDTHVPTLTGEGGHLRRDLTLSQHRDFELVPDALWRALAAWYGGSDPLPRQVIRPPNSDVELELYPLQLKILRHVPSTQRSNSIYSGVGVGGVLPPSPPSPPDRQLAYTAAFSSLATVKQVTEFLCGALGLQREAVRLWAVAASCVLLDDESPTLRELRLQDGARVLLELRNQDLTWPEEIGTKGNTSRATERRETLVAPNLPGATGLHNLGNTCYMNAALQAVWNTGPLTRYFNSGMHMYELNTSNPLGTKGVLAMRFAELCKEVWSMSHRSVAPWRMAGCVARYARALAGGGQHDAQELLAWLLDALHEELAQPPEPSDPSGLPKSIITSLFYGQLRSRVRCESCGKDSVRLDPFNMLSLPLPMEHRHTQTLRVMLLDGSVPVKYGVRVHSEGTYLDLKRALSRLCHLPPHRMLLVELSGATIRRVLDDSSKISSSAQELVAYELPGDVLSDTSDSADDLQEAWRGSMEECGEESAGAAGARRVSGGGGAGAQLCMPQLFCFKRSRSDILMSQSPPSTFYGRSHVFTDIPTSDETEVRSNTLPRNKTSWPNLSVRSLNLKSSPRLAKVKFASSPSNMYKMNEMKNGRTGRIQYLVAVHRKQCRSDAYFLPSQRCKPSLFGVPLLVPIHEHMSGRELYAQVWTQLARLLSARPSSEHHNHAMDCDDSLGYEFPFTLRVVSAGGARSGGAGSGGAGSGGAGSGGAGSGGAWCALCAWPALCRGCALPSTTEPLLTGCNTPRPRRKSSAPREPASSLARARLHKQAATRLDEQLTDGESYPGEIERLDLSMMRSPPGCARRVMLAIDWDPTALHLRYHSTREKEFTEHRSVRECREEASRPVELASCLRAFTAPERLEQPYHCSHCRSLQPATKTLRIQRAPPILITHLKRFQYMNNKWIKSHKVVNFPLQDLDPTEYLATSPDMLHEGDTDGGAESDQGSPGESAGDEEWSSPQQPAGEELTDPHHHQLLPHHHPLDIRYRLYAVVSHSGQLSTGHYVTYARNPHGTWLCFNDSMCRPLGAAPALDPATAYILFYERQGLDYEAYLPDTGDKRPVLTDASAHLDDTDLHKMCVLS